MENLRDVLVEQLADLYSAENRLIDALPKTAKTCSSTELKRGMEKHLAETKNQLARLEKIGQLLNEPLEGHTCQAMKGLIKEAKEIMKDSYEVESLKDAMMVSIAQKIEHYEIAGYGNAIALANFLDLAEVSALLEVTLKEEKATDEALTEITQSSILPTCESECNASSSDRDAAANM